MRYGWHQSKLRKSGPLSRRHALPAVQGRRDSLPLQKGEILAGELEVSSGYRAAVSVAFRGMTTHPGLQDGYVGCQGLRR